MRDVRAVLALAAVLATAACAGHAASSPSGDDEASAAPNAAVAIGLGTVRRERVARTVAAFGSVAGGRNAQALLAFPEGGRIASIAVSVGDRVAAGSALATLEAAPFEEDLAQASAALAAARANAEKATSAARPQQRAQTRAQADAARAQLEVARAHLAREQTLFRIGVAPAADVETARAAVVGSDSALRVLVAQGSSESMPFAPDVAVARAGIGEAAAAVDAARAKIGLATLRAPFAGTVVAVAHSEGEIVDPTAPILTLVNTAAAVFTAQFTPSDAAQIAPGDAARIAVRSTAGEANARVVAIDPMQSADARTIAVLLRISSGDPLAFAPGAYGQAIVRVGETSGLVVAASAIVADPTTGAAHVFRKTNDRYDAVPVEVKRETDGRAWIASASLRAGDRVVTSGVYSLEH